MKALSFMLLMMGISFIIIEAIIFSYALKPAENDADYVIVLGSQMREEGPSLDFKARLDSTYDYFIDHPDTMIISTGAKGPSEPVSEGQGGAEYLIRKGVPKEKILIEDQSYNTYQNLENAAKLISQEGEDPSDSRIVIVSASYHLYRAQLLAKKLGFDHVSCKGGHGLLILQPHYYTREFFALIKECITTLR
ncbi:MAG: YdcF family protein [Erysipelotrichaceae bacterium]|nr:YdcF family protein [Erysipelotrichaceae bacterium]